MSGAASDCSARLVQLNGVCVCVSSGWRMDVDLGAGFGLRAQITISHTSMALLIVSS